MSTMKDLARIVADRYDISRQESEQFVADMFDLLKAALSADEQVKIKGLGTFKVQTMQERKSVNVNTGEQIVIDSHDRISFTPDASMKESVNKPFAHFETVAINDGVVFDDIEDIPTEQPEPPVIIPLTPKEPEPVLESQAIVIPETVPAVPDMTNNDSSAIIMEPYQPTVSEPAMVPTPEPVVVPTPEPVVVPTPEPVVVPTSEPPTVSTTEAAAFSSSAPTEVPTSGHVETIPPESDETTKDEPHHPHRKKHKQKVKIKQRIYADEDMGNHLDPSKDYDSISISWAFFLAVLILVVGFVLGRATSDITVDDIVEKIYPSEKPTIEDTVEFTSIDETIAADSIALEKLKEYAQAEKRAAADKAAADKAAADKTAADKAAADKAAADKAAADKAAADKAAADKATSDKVAAAKVTQQSGASADGFDSSKYDSDPRVRLGAYRIVGVQKTVTVAAGQTLSSISKSHLGPGMECYVEAINGVKEVKAGQKLKIPELKIKKKKKQ